MKVRATNMGYFDHARRRPGDVFTIPDEPRRAVRTKDEIESDTVFDPVEGRERKIPKRRFRADGPVTVSIADTDGTVPEAFAEQWMEPVDAAVPERVTTGVAALKAFHDQTLADRSGAGTGSQEVI